MKYLIKKGATQADKLQTVKNLLNGQILDSYKNGKLSLAAIPSLSKLGLLEKPGFTLWGADLVKTIEESNKVAIVFKIEEGDGNSCKIGVSYQSLSLVDWGAFIRELEGNTSDGFCTIFDTNKDDENFQYYLVEDKETETINEKQNVI